MTFTGESRGHLKIRRILEESGMDFKEEYSFPNLVSSSGRKLRFDFMVLHEDGDPDFAIEVNGEQHYEAVSAFGGEKGFRRQRFNDNKKKNFCEARGIILVSIPYWELDQVNLEYILKGAGLPV